MKRLTGFIRLLLITAFMLLMDLIAVGYFWRGQPMMVMHNPEETSGLVDGLTLPFFLLSTILMIGAGILEWIRDWRSGN